MFNTQIFHFIGGSSALDTPILLLSTWHAIRHLVSGVLWNYRKLDCISNQCPLRWVPHQKGKGKRQLQEPCHSGSSLVFFFPSSLLLNLYKEKQQWLNGIALFWIAVVRSPWWVTWSILESSGASLQLYFPTLWICDTAYSMCKVTPLLRFLRQLELI